MNQQWHEDCFKCFKCGTKLTGALCVAAIVWHSLSTGLFFEHEKKPYCEKDFQVSALYM